MIRLALLALLVLSLVLWVTNPNPDAHRKAVYTSVATANTHSQFLGKIAADVLGSANLLPLEYNNYYLFSTTKLNGKIRSVGVGTRVWQLK